MTRWYPLEAADAGIFTSAPHVFRYEKHFDAPPERVWESLISDESLAAWSPLVSRLAWLSARPFATGTIREVALAPGLTRVRERYFRWDEGRGNSFYVYESNVPVFRRFAEDYLIEADGAGTKYTWTVAIEAKPALAVPFKALAPVLKAVFGRMAADAQRYFGV